MIIKFETRYKAATNIKKSQRNKSKISEFITTEFFAKTKNPAQNCAGFLLCLISYYEL
jgi:hypothetical protein